MVGGPQLIIILVVVLVLFGGKKLPELARSLGQAKREFESGITEGGGLDDGSAETASTGTGSSAADDGDASKPSADA